MASPTDTATSEHQSGSDLGAATENLRERVSTLADRASEVAGQVRDQAAAAASDLARPMKERARDLAEEQKQAGADRLGGVARAVHQAADQLDKDLPPEASRYVHQAAAGIERVSSAIRERSVGELIDEVSDFARRQPVAFFGGAVLAGFVLSRFLKSSAETGPRGGSSSGARGGYTGEFGAAPYEPGATGGTMYGVPSGGTPTGGVNPGAAGPSMPK
ncbi:MAG TPA: hypothetical protein VGB82_19280 [Alphaproteobacteria bacterium]